MKVKVNAGYRDAREYYSLENYAGYALDGDEYGLGAMEAAAKTAENNSRAIGRLLDLLAERRMLSAKETETIIAGCSTEATKFVEQNKP